MLCICKVLLFTEQNSAYALQNAVRLQWSSLYQIRLANREIIKSVDIQLLRSVVGEHNSRHSKICLRRTNKSN